jgi:hypothetical protein
LAGWTPSCINASAEHCTRDSLCLFITHLVTATVITAGSLLVDYSLPDYYSRLGNNRFPGDDNDVEEEAPHDSEAPPRIPHHPIKTFADYATLEAFVRAHCEAHGYVIAIISTKKQGREKWICCAKGVKRKLKEESKIKKGSKITGCSFSMRCSLVDDSTTSWHLTYPRGIVRDHNHDPTDASKVANLRRNARKNTALSEYVAVLRTAGIPAKQIKAAAKLQFVNLAIPLTSTDICNEIGKQRRDELAGSTVLNPT